VTRLKEECAEDEVKKQEGGKKAFRRWLRM